MAEKQVKPAQGHGPGGRMKFEKPKNTKKTLLRLLSYVLHHSHQRFINFGHFKEPLFGFVYL